MDNGVVNNDGSYLINERFDFETEVPTNICPTLEKCCYEKADRTSLPDFEAPKKCGLRNPKGIGGKVSSKHNPSFTEYAQYAEFPWMMAVLFDRSGVLSYKCGGSLIHPKVILTAAHKIAGYNPKNIVVRGGEWDTQTDKEMFKHVEREVEQVILHENYTRSNFHNSIALLVLTQEFKLTSFINTICLPPSGMNFDNQRCLASGWGSDSFGKSGKYQVFLKKVELPVVPNSICQTLLRRTRIGQNFNLHEKHMCAGKITLMLFKTS